MEAVGVHDHGDCDLFFVFDLALLVIGGQSRLQLSGPSDHSSHHLFLVLFLDLMIHEGSLVVLLDLCHVLLECDEYLLVIG